jgi:hypothetical protein
VEIFKISAMSNHLKGSKNSVCFSPSRNEESGEKNIFLENKKRLIIESECKNSRELS